MDAPPDKPPYFSRSPTAAVVVAIAAVSFSAIFIRWSSAHPLVISFYRLLFTSLLILPFSVKGLARDWRRLSGRDLALMVSVGAVLAVHFSLWVTSLQMTSVVSSTILVTSHPLFVGIVASYFLKERLRRIHALGIAFSLLGVGLLSLGDWGMGTESILGDILAFLGGMAAGAYILGGRHFRKTYSLATYTSIVYFSATGFLLLFVIMASVPLFSYPREEYLLFLLMAVVPGILGHTLYNWALRYVRAVFVSITLLGEPVGSGILAWLLLGEVPPALSVAGGVFILAGIYFVSLKTGADDSQRAAGPESGG